MTILQHNLQPEPTPAQLAGGLLLPGRAYPWAGARLTSCGFMAAPAAS